MRELQLLGRVGGMDRKKVAKKTFENKSESRRRVGRSRLRWLEHVVNDL
jgi:hypothetical protein